MNKFKFVTFAFALLVGASFVSCSDDDDAPAYEQVIINQAASAGLKGNVKSVETIDYDCDWDEENDKIVKEDPTSKSIVFYDKKGVQLGYENYEVYTDNNKYKFRLSDKKEIQYDNRYRVTLELVESYFYYYDDAEYDYKNGYMMVSVYDDAKGTATVSGYYWDEESEEYVLDEVAVHPLNPNGTIDEDVYAIYEKRATETLSPNYNHERVVLEEDAQKNWTKAYYKGLYFDEDGGLIDSYTQYDYYAERTIVYY